MLETRQDVVRGWSAVADDLVLQGQAELAQAVRGFVKQLPPVRTEREWVREDSSEQATTERHRAVASWQAFRAQQQKAAEQARQLDLDWMARGSAIPSDRGGVHLVWCRAR